MQPIYDVAILGAGASGLSCAFTLTGGTRHSGETHSPAIALIDASPVPGRKLRIAGGGMGNMTNRTLTPDFYVGTDTAFVRTALRKFTDRAMLGLLNFFKMPVEERNCGQVFCLQPVSRLVDAMSETLFRRHVDFRLGHAVEAVSHQNGVFTTLCSTSQGDVQILSRLLVIAMGSPACPGVGATDTALRIARSLGHGSIPFHPVLTPLILPENHPLIGLQGISINVGIPGTAEHLARPLLFTHKGISGPAGLIASCIWNEGSKLFFDLLPYEQDIFSEPGTERLMLTGFLRRRFPQRLADALAGMFTRSVSTAFPKSASTAILTRPFAEWGRKDRKRFADFLHQCDMTPIRSEGMRTAEAASGGIKTEMFDPATMQSRLVPGLYATGECLDIAGLLGGYNIHFAMASGYLAGKHIISYNTLK